VKTVRVAGIMTRNVLTATEDAPFKHLVKLMHECGVSGIPIVDKKGLLVGIVTEADLLRAAGHGRPPRSGFLEWFLHPAPLEELEQRIEDLRAGDVMTRDVVSVHPETPVAEAAKMLLQAGVKRLPVTDPRGRVVGIASRGDLLRPFLRRDEDIRTEIAHEVVLRAMWLDPATVDVKVRGGVVTLAGTVERRSEKEILVELTRRVAGVVGVEDRLAYREDDRDLDRRVALPETLRTRFR
jgi:CBS domain-containing protein